MATPSIVPRFIVDESGKRTQVVLSVRDYNRLLAAWEDVADARDFGEAKRTSKTFVPLSKLSQTRKRRK
ncbi:MAG: hypothetical protein HUU46_05875 [Candidatus Hydrogenedentes bacterium]|nr:hypothetical protein [Candidatus Hydrogenedentota bacterium]